MIKTNFEAIIKVVLSKSNKTKNTSDKLRVIIDKLFREEHFNNNGDKLYLLSFAIYLVKFVDQMEDKKDNLNIKEFAYALILRYSLLYEDFDLLHLLADNIGFYPISHIILKKKLANNLSIQHLLSETKIQINFEDNDKILTHEQKIYSDLLLADNSSSILAYFAPTSYAKSELILEKISKLNSEENKDKYRSIIIIVPTKALLQQVNKDFRHNPKLEGLKIILHDEMYDPSQDTRILAILTQERAIRFLHKYKEFAFDYVIIDEAHKMLDKEDRANTLFNFRKINKERNSSHKVFYLSPVLEDIAELYNINKKESGISKIIRQSVKELNLYLFDNNEKQVQVFNRYLDTVDSKAIHSNINSWHDCVIKCGKDRSFIYLNSPLTCERAASTLYDNLSDVKDDDIGALINLLKEHFHENLKVIKFLQRGILYLHGKMPDTMKDFLIHKFIKIKTIKYLCANAVVLEGMNLPIDSIFIAQFFKGKDSLSKRDLVNLIGRVNRLKDIFDKENPNLDKLLVPVYFLGIARGKEINKIVSFNTVASYAKKLAVLNDAKIEPRHQNMLLVDEKIIDEKMRELESKDTIEAKKELKQYENYKSERILVNEESDIITANDESIKSKLVKNSLYYIYNKPQTILTLIQQNIEKEKSLIDAQEEEDRDKLIEKAIKLIGTIFFSEEIMIVGMNHNNKDAFSIGRLSNEKTRNYYQGFLKTEHKTFKERIEDDMEHNFNEELLYVGASYGEVSREGEMKLYKSYVNLRKKDTLEKINYAIIRLKDTEDFVSFHLNKFFSFLHDCRLLNDKEYVYLNYGFKDESSIKYVKHGLSISLITYLKDSNKLDTIKFKDNKIMGNETYSSFYSEQDEFMKFMLDQYIDR